MNFRQIHFFTLCFLVASMFLIGTGCEPKDPDQGSSGGGDRSPLPPPPPPPPPDPYREYMSAEESKQWLKDNHYNVQKEGNQYIITRDYYDPKTRTRDNSRVVLSARHAAGTILDVTIALDDKGMLRVRKHRN